jgi:hypothetical protein
LIFDTQKIYISTSYTFVKGTRHKIESVEIIELDTNNNFIQRYRDVAVRLHPVHVLNFTASKSWKLREFLHLNLELGYAFRLNTRLVYYEILDPVTITDSQRFFQNFLIPGNNPILGLGLIWVL